MELLNSEELVGDSKTDGTVVANLDVFKVGKQIAEIANDFEFARLAQRASQLQVSRHRGLAGYPPLQVGPEDGIHIEMVEMEVYGGRPISTKLNLALDV